MKYKSHNMYFDIDLTIPFLLPMNSQAVVLNMDMSSHNPVTISSKIRLIDSQNNPWKKDAGKELDAIEFEGGRLIIKISEIKKMQKNFNYNKEGLEILKINHISKSKKNIDKEFFILPLFDEEEQDYVLIISQTENDKTITNALQKIKQQLIEKKDTIESYNALIQKYDRAVIEINSNLLIENFNTKAKELFTDIKLFQDFLGLWGIENKKQIINYLENISSNQNLTFYIFEKINNHNTKLRITLTNISTETKFNFLTIIENMNQIFDLEKEITKKELLLHLNYSIGLNLEDPNSRFVQNILQKVVETFNFNGAYWFSLLQERENANLIYLLQNQSVNIDDTTFENHIQYFSKIRKRYIKRIEVEKIFSQSVLRKLNSTKSKYLMAVPIYEKNVITGVMTYLSNFKEIDIEFYNHLYSISIFLNKIMRYRGHI
ncbi:hypothetical protein [Algoriphagus marincola]|uniref:hypothetical protein n=1 Tax=Algoriphagus marincola TaxID=264027 RepID=UPI000424A52A|nr:hypothetical protein [Algoriphagus marincola]